MINFFRSRALVVIFLFLLIFPTISSLARPGYFPMHDDMQAMRLVQMDKCITDGQIPCRWVPDMGFGYGYPQFNYYAPLPYYVMETFHLAGFGFLDSVKIGFGLAVVVAAYGMYLLGASLWGKPGGFISGLIYTYAPYKAVDLYVRGAMGELWGIVALPYLFWAARELVLGKKRSLVKFALALSALLVSHNITALIFVPLTLVWIAFQLFLTERQSPTEIVEKLKSVFLGFLWGGALSAFFVLPALFESRFVHVETLLEGYFNYINHFVSVKQLLLETHWQYGTSEVGPYDDILLAVGLIQWVLPLTAVTLLVFLKKKKEALFAAFFTLVGWLSLFMAHPKSSFIWDKLPFLAYLQFPWRFLMFATFFFALASGAIFKVVSKTSKLVPIVFIFVVMLLYMLTVSYFRPRVWLDTTDAEKFSGESWQLQQTISIFDYLPVYADKPPAQKAPDLPEVVGGTVDFGSWQKGSDWQKWEIDVSGDGATLALPLLYFPGWKAQLDGKEIPVSVTQKTGLIRVEVAGGKHTLEAGLTDTPIRKASNILSCIALLMIPVYITKRREK